MRDIDKMIERFLDMELVGTNNEVIFTDEAKMLIHKIAEECSTLIIVLANEEKMEEYGKGLSAEDVYVDMLLKIIYAPTAVHMLMSAILLIPIIDKKLRKEGDE